ncbi:MAG TPA: acetate kinase [Ignavibacteria bacterium]|nr:acetate kinase [Ignavibacteria bacterium]
MKILVLNCGSSSLKFQMLNMDDESVLAKGLVERIGNEGSVFSYTREGSEKIKVESEIKDHTDAVNIVIKYLTSPEHGVLKSLSEIDAVGHRLVHGGEKYASSVFIDEDVVQTLRDCTVFSPLHNPANILGIEACRKVLPGVPMAGTFDTAFHQTMPAYSYMYALPYSVYEKYHIRRYGFHGTSHRYVSQIAIQKLNKEHTKIITCHLGNGSSVAAIVDGKSLDTSMGHTPVGGLIMGTRSGDLDPGILTFLETEGLRAKDIDNMVNKKSGVLGISGISNDFRDLENALHEGNSRAKLALEMFDFKLRKYIGAYAAIMGGVDAIVFTAGIGENDWETRYEAVRDMEFFGIKLDEEKNKSIRGVFAEINTPDSKVKIYVIPTNEELMIARDAKDIISKMVEA